MAGQQTPELETGREHEVSRRAVDNDRTVGQRVGKSRTDERRRREQRSKQEVDRKSHEQEVHECRRRTVEQWVNRQGDIFDERRQAK
jgi:hypothetical protein